MTSKLKLIGALAVILAAMVLPATAWHLLAAGQEPATPHDAPNSGVAVPAPAGSLPVLWNAPAFSFLDQDGQRVTNQALRGRVWVADFIYTQCTSACPTMTAKMVLLQRQVRNPEVRFISFSVDPEHDTPAALKTYAGLWHSNDPRWRLLSTDPAGLARTTAGMKVSVLHDDDEEHTIIHSTLFSLVDGQGCVRGVYNSNDATAMKKLAADTEALAGGAAPEGNTFTAITPAPGQMVQATVNAGAAMFYSLGCGACHNQAKLAPPLGGLYKSLVKLDTGAVVRADEAYLLESIVDPGAKIVAGYGHTMPSYRSYVTPEQINQIVDYLKTLRAVGVGSAEAAVRTLAVDPVCGMQISVGADTLHVTYAGRDYYFCSVGCRRVFLINPLNYVKTANPAGQSKPGPGSG